MALAERELAAVHAAAGFSQERADRAAHYNRRLLEALGFGRGTLAEDLAEDDDEEEEEDWLASPGAAGGLLRGGGAGAAGAGSAMLCSSHGWVPERRLCCSR